MKRQNYKNFWKMFAIVGTTNLALTAYGAYKVLEKEIEKKYSAQENIRYQENVGKTQKNLELLVNKLGEGKNDKN